MSQWNHYVSKQDFNGLENYIKDLHITTQKNLYSRLLNYYFEKNMFSRFDILFKNVPETVQKQECILSLYIRILCINDNINTALEIISSLENADELKRRHIYPILLYYHNNNMDAAVETLIKYKYLFTTDDIELIINKTIEMKRYDLLFTIFHIIEECFVKFSNVSLPKVTIIDNKCTNCNNTLHFTDMNTYKFIEKTVFSHPEINKFLKKYTDFLDKTSYDCVIDGGNVLHALQGKVIDDSFTLMNNIIKNTKKVGFKNILLIIHERHKKYTNKIFIELLKSVTVYWTPRNMDDDLFSLIAAWYKYPTKLITRDLFRNHKFIVDNSEINNWYDTVSITYNNGGFITLPPQFTYTIQYLNSNWHVPLKDKTWICIYRNIHL
jgi:hypothetical protein